MWTMFVHELVSACIFLRRLRVYGVDKSIMLLFYRSTVESIICYGFTNWFGYLTVKLRSQLQNVVRRAGKIIGMLSPLSLQDIFERSVRKQSLKIIGNPSHILHKEYELMPSGRRYRVPICKLNRYKSSLIPLSVNLLNNK